MAWSVWTLDPRSALVRRRKQIRPVGENKVHRSRVHACSGPVSTKYPAEEEGINTRVSVRRIGELSFITFQYESPPMRISTGKSFCKSVLGSAKRNLRPRARFPTTCGTAGCGESVCALSKALIGIIQLDQIPVTLNRTSLRRLGGAGCDSNAETFSSRCLMVLSFRSSINLSVIKLDWLSLSSTQRVNFSVPWVL